MELNCGFGTGSYQAFGHGVTGLDYTLTRNWLATKSKIDQIRVAKGTYTRLTIVLSQSDNPHWA